MIAIAPRDGGRLPDIPYKHLSNFSQLAIDCQLEPRSTFGHIPNETGNQLAPIAGVQLHDCVHPLTLLATSFGRFSFGKGIHSANISRLC